MSNYITFKKIAWKNFLSTGNHEVEIELDKASSTLIVGQNGTGKSTILDALCFSLFGKAFRNVNKNQLINSINGKGTVVTLEFEASGVEYRIVRGIKPNVFEIWRNGELLKQDAKARDYQKSLERQILKLNYRTFTQVVILGSASFVPFMQLPAAERREVIEDVLDIRIFSTMKEILKEKKSATSEELRNVDSKITEASNEHKYHTKMMEEIEKQINEVKNDNAAEIKKIDDELSNKKTQVKELNSALEKLKENFDGDDLDRLDGHRMEASKNIAALTTSMGALKKTRDFFKNNDNCPTCSQLIEENFKNEKIETSEKEMEDSASKIGAIEKAIENINATIQNVKKKKEAINTAEAKLNAALSEAKALIKRKKEMESKAQKTSDASEEMLAGKREERKKIAARGKELVAIRDEVKERLRVQEICALMLKDTGIKSNIIREYVPIMNELINRYLSDMNSYVRFELDENFNEIVKSRNRDDFSYRSFSEGEKMRIDLAILFTWRVISKMKNSVNTNLLVLDEIFDSSLDSAGTDSFLSLMNSLKGETNVVVISHKGDVISDDFQRTLEFSKKNDFSVMKAVN